VLSDGSRVWLNAASQLRYPALFAGASRTVELEGEGYFEVATNARQPFVVKLAKGAEVTVVGTRFNARAYGEDAGAVVSLEEGRVRLRQGADSLLLQPGEQVKAGAQGVQKVTHPGMAAATAWRRGQFVFRDAEIGTILEELARWYDVAVVYRTRNKEHFNLTVRRTDSLTHILRLLELTHTIHFTIENKTVYVLP
jgi:ferric-dicitrate binding protein FerR (iron transport regulator)